MNHDEIMALTPAQLNGMTKDQLFDLPHQARNDLTLATLATLRADRRAAMLAELDRAFVGRPLWPAQQVKMIIGINPLDVPEIRREIAEFPDIPRAMPGGGMWAAGPLNPMLSYLVNGADVRHWVETQP